MATRTISNAGGNYNAVGAWVEGAVPTSSDDVVATATSGNLTITANAVAKSVDLTGYVAILTHNNSITWTVSGSFKLATGMNYTIGGLTSEIILNNSTVGNTLTTNGKTLPNLSINYGSDTASCILQDNLTCGILTINRGIFTANNRNVTCTAWTCVDADVNVTNMGSGTWTILCTDEVGGYSINAFNLGSITINANTSTIVLNNPPVTTKNFNLYGNNIYNLTINGNGTYISHYILLDITVTNSLVVNGPNKVKFGNGGLYTINNLFTTNGSLVTFTSDAPGFPFIFSSTLAITRNFTNLSITDSTASGGTWIASSSIDGGGNSGWIINPLTDSISCDGINLSLEDILRLVLVYNGTDYALKTTLV